MPIYDNQPDNINLDAVDVLGAGKNVAFVHDPALGAYRAQRSTDTQPPGTGPLLLQTSGSITTTSQALPSVPTGAGYARLRLGVGISARYDGTPATGGPSDESYIAGGTLELLSAGEIAGFRFIGTATGTYSIVYRSS